MKNIFFWILILCFCTSCQSNKDNLQEFTLCEVNKIYLPAYLTEKVGGNPKGCSGKLNLVNKDTVYETLLIDFCTYQINLGKRPDYGLLKQFFKENYDVIPEEIPETERLEIHSEDKGDYYFFSYSYIDFNDNQYILRTDYAFENGFINILYKTDKENKAHIKEMEQIINTLRFKNIDKCVDVKMLRMNCDWCDFTPTFW